MNKGTLPWVIAAALSLVLLGAFLTNRGRQANQPTPTPQPTEESRVAPDVEGDPGTIGQIVMQGASAVYVASQKPGDSVTVSTVFFAEPGFIAIYESEGGEPGELVGVSNYVESSADMIEIQLEAPTVDGEEYIAMLHKDNGNAQWDGEEVDTPVIFNDEQISMIFMISESAEDVPEVAF